MVTKVETVVTLTDDIDGTEADRTVSFALDRRSYQIDLSKKNADALAKVLAPYLAAARTTVGRGTVGGHTRRRSRNTASTRREMAAIREWAKANGYVVADRGRIPATATDAYRAGNR